MENKDFYAKGLAATREACGVTNGDVEEIVVLETPSKRVMAPRFVYKYRNYGDERHRRLLTNQELYLSSPLDFDDKKDCSLDYYIPPKGELFDFYCKHLPPRLIDAPRCEKRRYAKEMSKSGLLTNVEEERRVQREIDERRFKQFGVLSLSKRYDIDYMWEYYGDNYKGFCIGFDTKILCDSGLFGGGGDVVYYDELPLLSVDEPVDSRVVKSIFSKLRDPYENEDEYRLTKSWPYEATIADRTKVVPIDSVVCLVLGRDMTDVYKKEIKEIRTEIYPTAKLIEL